MQDSILEGTDMVELGRCIRSIREASNMTAEQLAEAAGYITRPSLTRIEIGKAQSPSFDTVFRILKVVGQLSIVKNGDFDFRPYSKEIVDLIHYFIKENKETIWPNYNQVVSRQIAENCDHWPKRELDTLLFFVECKNIRDDVMPQADKLDKELLSRRMDVTDVDPEDASQYVVNNTDYVLRLRKFALILEKESQYPGIFKLIGELLEKVCHYIELMPTEE